MAEQKKAEEFGITEDDVSEIRQDINKFRNRASVFSAVQAGDGKGSNDRSTH